MAATARKGTAKTATKKPPSKKTAAKSANKTQPTAVSVEAFIANVPNEIRRRDAKTLLALMKKLSGETPRLWGPSMIGFGTYHYKYASGREGDFFLTGFSPRASSLVVYIMDGYQDNSDLLAKLGKHKTGKSCLYVNRLEDIDMNVLEKLVLRSLAYMRKTYKTG